jgi:hypothetical protein
MSRYGFAGLVVAALLFVSVPWIAHRFFSAKMLVDATPSEKKDEAFVFGGRRMSGFLVVKDDMPVGNDVPSLTLSQFESILGLSGIESQNPTNLVLPALPFGFVFAPRLERGSTSGSLYIVPSAVVERRNVGAWHFDLKRGGYRLGGYGWYVTKAEPWP